MYERKITLPLTDAEWRALCENARSADRTPKLQARHLLKVALGTPPTNATNPVAEVSQAAATGFVEANL